MNERSEMIQQIPQKQLMDFWPYFERHKIRNILAQNLAWSNVRGFVDNLKNPDVVMFLCQQGACFLAGNNKAENLKEFLVKIPEKAYIYVPSLEWESSLKPQWTYFGYIPRTELSAKSLSLQSIRELLNSLPKGFQMKRVDIEAAKQILNQNFSNHLVELVNYFGSPEKFVEEGVGFCIQENETIFCIVMGFMASVPITQSVELDIATHPDYRGRGFATLVSAKLIEYFLKKGIEPHWDAANPLSVKLAQKLGYTDPEPYKCYYWRKNPWTVSELKEAFHPQFEKGVGNIRSIKSEIVSVIAKEQNKKARLSLLSQLTKTRWIFEEILFNINRFLETKIVKESDIPQFKEYSEKLKQQLDTLDKLKNGIITLK
ncbi:MAG: GNAT family N-acetyltransferase [Candidatus Hodarchaeales archaeon]|jgi:GNAT superfamily N-acetyltransferase